jgi:hypothetical protein
VKRGTNSAMHSGWQSYGGLDGSFAEEWGKASGAIIDREEQVLLRVDVITPSKKEDQCCLLSKRGRKLHAVCAWVRVICNFFHVQDGRIVLACDGLSVKNGQMYGY